MYILIGVIFLVAAVIWMQYGGMSYFQRNWKEWGYRNSDAKDAENIK
jgi:hypothetical protein